MNESNKQFQIYSNFRFIASDCSAVNSHINSEDRA